MGDRKRERGRARARAWERERGMLTSMAPPYLRLSMFVVSDLLTVRHYVIFNRRIYFYNNIHI
jgi:hypothetical protein